MKRSKLLVSLMLVGALTLTLSVVAGATNWESWYGASSALTMGSDVVSGNTMSLHYSGHTTHHYAAWDCARHFSFGHTIWKWSRAAGDANAYDVSVNLGVYNETDDPFYLAVGGDAFGAGDGTASYWTANPAAMTVIGTTSGTAFIPAGTQSFYLIAANNEAGGAYNGFAYTYGLNVDFTPAAVPEPGSLAGLASGIGFLGFAIRRRIK